MIDGKCLKRTLESQGPWKWVSVSPGFLFPLHSLRDRVKSTDLPPATHKPWFICGIFCEMRLFPHSMVSCGVVHFFQKGLLSTALWTVVTTQFLVV